MAKRRIIFFSFFVFIFVSVVAFFLIYKFRNTFFEEGGGSAKITRKDYLLRIYPLLKPEQATYKLFNDLNFYYKPFPKINASIYKFGGRHTKPPEFGQLVCLSWVNCTYKRLFSHRHKLHFVYGVDGDVFKNDYDPGNINSYKYKNGFPSASYVEVYHNSWYQEPGHFYYRLKGSGIFLNLGKTLIAKNKVEAMLKLGVSEGDVFTLLNTFSDEQNNTRSPYQFVKSFAEKHGLNFKQAVKDVIDSCAEGSVYITNRIANTTDLDYALWRLGKKKGYDTIQFTIQPNGNSGWGYEILDLRNNSDLSLKDQWKNSQKYFSIRNPVDLNSHAPCTYDVPFKRLYCEHGNIK